MKKLTYQEALEEFNQLLNDDPGFQLQWGHNSEKKQQDAFFEWCSNWEDTSHITKKIALEGDRVA